jgi:hypothetical protein
LQTQGGQLALRPGGGCRRCGVELDREVFEPENDELGELRLKSRSILQDVAARAENPLEVRRALDGRDEPAGLAVASPQSRDDLLVPRGDDRGNLFFR